MEKKKLTLEIAVKLRERLDREIHDNYQKMITYNSVKENEEKIDIRNLAKLTEEMEKQVNSLKEEIQKANLKRHSFEWKSNAYYIVRLSQLKIKKGYLMKMPTKKRVIGKIKYVIEYTANEVNRMIREINDEIDKISQKLTNFNKTKTLKIKIEDKLLYLLN